MSATVLLVSMTLKKLQAELALRSGRVNRTHTVVLDQRRVQRERCVEAVSNSMLALCESAGEVHTTMVVTARHDEV